MSSRMAGYLPVSLAMMTVGSTVIASKLIAGHLPAFLATALRFAVAMPFLCALVIFRHQRWPRLNRREWGLLLLQAGTGSVGYTTLLISGLNYLPAADAGVIIGTLPAVSALFSVTVLGERPHGKLIASVLLATVGVVAVAWTGPGPASLSGVLLIPGAVVCESAFILLSKRMPVPLPPLLQATAMTGLGLLVSLPFAVFELPSALPATAAMVAVVWYALIPTVGGFLLWYAGAARVSGSEAATLTAVAPLTAVALAAFFLGERIGVTQVFGIAAVILAILTLALPVRAQARL
ncbi:DMT family transporter [Verminephrobacter eiseniae]|uniref:DMT family transporter n=1 Tax=Verminephrobacter eiseniae TaxID=364317 RepID=UPI002237621D|nr:DMT family transporter [Verminephrobacter eiseniae]MCW5237432.1 DMT family transporter [Verminephrobacter eiseniae]